MKKPTQQHQARRYGLFGAWVEALPSQGRYSFSRDEAMKILGCSRKAFIQAARRLTAKKKITRVHGKFYVVIPLEYAASGIIPADWFIHDLMTYFKQPYYVGGLSAAEYHGAAHQRPQWLHVFTDRPIREIRCKGVGIRFFVKRAVGQTPIQQIKVVTGYIPVSTPEATALDLVHYARRLGGIDHVLTVLQELGVMMNPPQLARAARLGGHVAVAQKLGWLLEKAGFKKKTGSLKRWVEQRRSSDTKLIPSLPIRDAIYDKTWKLWINSDIEGDLT